MSQHLFSTQHNGHPVVVLMGWDRPLQGFFLVVEATDKPDEYVYTSMEDPTLGRWRGMPPALDLFVDRLRDLGISVPERMIEEVRADARGNVGNRYVSYNEHGSVIDCD